MPRETEAGYAGEQPANGTDGWVTPKGRIKVTNTFVTVRPFFICCVANRMF